MIGAFSAFPSSCPLLYGHVLPLPTPVISETHRAEKFSLPTCVHFPVKQNGMEGQQGAQTGSGPPPCPVAICDKVHVEMQKLGSLMLCDSTVTMKFKNEHIN